MFMMDMKRRMKMKKFRLTAGEVIASIVLLGAIVVGLAGMFILSGI